MKPRKTFDELVENPSPLDAETLKQMVDECWPSIVRAFAFYFNAGPRPESGLSKEAYEEKVLTAVKLLDEIHDSSALAQERT